MKQTLLPLAYLAFALAGCARPGEVRNLSEAVHPIAVQMKNNSENLQKRFVLQRDMIERRALDLSKAAADRRARTLDIERVWRMTDDKARLRKLAILQELDAEILANPLATVMADAKFSASKPPKLNQGSMDTFIKNIASLRGEQQSSLGDLLGFLQEVNNELGKLDAEQSEALDKAEQELTLANP